MEHLKHLRLDVPQVTLLAHELKKSGVGIAGRHSDGGGTDTGTDALISCVEASGLRDGVSVSARFRSAGVQTVRKAWLWNVDHIRSC